MGSMTFGYGRVSSQDQELARQIDALEKYGVYEIFTEKMTGTKANRPELNRLKDKVRLGDVVVIESLSRLGRSTKDLLSLIEDWNQQGVKLVSLKESIDTTTPTGKLLLTVLSAISQFERDITVQRTNEGLQAARARGRKGGRPKSDSMYVRGDRMCDIQNWLRDNEILTVGELRYRRTGRTQHPRPQQNAWYNWPDKTLYDILTRQEYLGHTITAKTYKVSYKSKKTRKNAEDKRYFFPNTHEPLIDEETFALAQKRIATRHRPAKSDEIDLFSGLLFCGDCGYKMYLMRGAGTPERKHGYTCGNYRNRARNDFLCTTHYIRKSVLKELVLSDL